jgi:glycine oxidase
MANRRERDVVVVGAGIVGLACAWRAAQAGLSVLVVERGEPGGAASAAAAGMLAPVTEAEFGEEELLRLNMAGRAEWPGFAAELSERSGLDIDYAETGALFVAADRDDVDELRRLNELQRSLGLDARWITGRDCRRLEPGLSPRVGGGVLATHEASVDPRAVVRALLVVLEQEGVDVATGCEAERIEESRGRVTGVATSSGSVPAARVVVACGPWSGSLHDSAPRVRPVKGQIVRLRGAPLAERIIRTPRCYVVSRPGGEIVVGATMEERGYDATVTAGAVHRLLEAAWEVLPDIEERELVEASAGLRPGTPDNRPVIAAAGPEGLAWATGHHRNGVLLAPITATIVTGMLVGRPAPVAGGRA